VSKRVKATMRSQPVQGYLTVQWTCPTCSAPREFSTNFSEIMGGCGGHGPEEYCYCSDPEIRRTVECPTCGQPYEVSV
jgi:transcription elongation factor Elf1